MRTYFFPFIFSFVKKNGGIKFEIIINKTKIIIFIKKERINHIFWCVARRHAFVSKRGHDNKSKKKVKNEEKKKKTVKK
jgi:hypothetical protein